MVTAHFFITCKECCGVQTNERWQFHRTCACNLHISKNELANPVLSYTMIRGFVSVVLQWKTVGHIMSSMDQYAKSKYIFMTTTRFCDLCF